MPAPRLAPLLVFALLLAAGCSSTRQIQTAPPHPAGEIQEQQPAERQAPVRVLFQTGDTPLPADVQQLRFRVAEIQFRQADGTWSSYPADVNTIEIRADGARVRKPVLSTQIPPAAYDSLALVLSHVYVEYDANAGAPLTMPRDMPTRVPLAFTTRAGRPTHLLLTFEPGASLSRSPDYRWFFLPFVTAEAETTAAP